MCGIAGEMRLNDSPVDQDTISRITESMSARGPDGHGLIVQGRFAFGHRRLAIVDPSSNSAQPMLDATLGLMIVFNGCIYNYLELREELIRLGHSFSSTGDTEVIIKAYHTWGEQAVERLVGMFAFAIGDLSNGSLFLARDRLGVKPLYYTRGEDFIRFASTLPSLLVARDINRTIDPEALQLYMMLHGIVPAPRTLLKGIFKLAPATTMYIHADGRLRERTYWRPSFERNDLHRSMTDDDWSEQILAAFRRAVLRRMVADVPVGLLLSGGLDSTAILAIMANESYSPPKTYSIGFETSHGESGDEFVHSDFVSRLFSTDHHKLFIRAPEVIDQAFTCISKMSEPMISHDCVGFFILSQYVSKDLKVVQCGQGADELFAGYHWYSPIAQSENYEEEYFRRFFDRSHEALSSQLAHRWNVEFDLTRELVTANLRSSGAGSPIDRVLRLDSTMMQVDDPLKRVDNMMMAFGVEARAPFVDHELFELVASAPPRLKLAQGGKGLLKSAVKHIVPSEIINRKKEYFPVPPLKYLEGELLRASKDILKSRPAVERHLFRTAYVDQLLKEPTSRITPLGASELWQIVTLESWLQTHEIY